MSYERIVSDLATGEQRLELLEPELIAELEAEAARIAALPTEEELQAQAEAKTIQRLALLDKLGITEDEARLLLGGN